MKPSGLLRFIVGLSLAFPPQTAELRAQQQPSSVRELDEAKALYREARLAECVTRLEAAIEKLRVLPPSDSRKRDLADAHLFLGLSKLALNERAGAKAALVEFVRLDPERRLDPEVYAPKVVELFEEARLQAQSRAADAAASAPSPRATPAPSPDREKKGSKLPLILLGVAGAGAGIAAAAGGAGATSPAAGTASAIPSVYDVALIGADPPQGSQLRAGVDNRVTLMFRFDVAAGERVVVTMFLGQGLTFDNRCFNFARTPPFSPGSSIPHTEVLTLPAACPLPKTFSVNVLFYKESLALQTEGIVLNRVFPSFYTLG